MAADGERSPLLPAEPGDTGTPGGGGSGGGGLAGPGALVPSAPLPPQWGSAGAKPAPPQGERLGGVSSREGAWSRVGEGLHQVAPILPPPLQASRPSPRGTRPCCPARTRRPTRP